jgi:hypothetical protein
MLHEHVLYEVHTPSIQPRSHTAGSIEKENDDKNQTRANLRVENKDVGTAKDKQSSIGRRAGLL